MRFDVLTIFPDLLSSPLQEGIIQKALASGKVAVNTHNIRDCALDKHSMTDDRPFGGGEGMVMKPEPIVASLEKIDKETFMKLLNSLMISPDTHFAPKREDEIRHHV